MGEIKLDKMKIMHSQEVTVDTDGAALNEPYKQEIELSLINDKDAGSIISITTRQWSIKADDIDNFITIIKRFAKSASK